MQRNRSYNQNFDEDQGWQDQGRNRNQQDRSYSRQEPDYSNQQSGQRWQPQQFPPNYSSNYPESGNREFNEGRNRQEPSSYRGAYRLDAERRDRSQYERLNEENFGDDYGYGHAGNSRNGGDRGRHQSDYGNASTYGASRNAGSMGSYGGAQGYGSSRNGTENYNWGSGHGRGDSSQPRHRVYGAYRDKNSFAEGETPSYDGSERYGSQGADNTQGWQTSGRSGSSGPYRRQTSQDDARYEIYDTSESQYNHGDYNNTTQGSISENLNLRSHQNYPPSQRYGSLQRAHNRQGSGSDQDRYSGGPDMGYHNTAGSLSIGYDGHRGSPGPSQRFYDPLSGDIRTGSWR